MTEKSAEAKEISAPSKTHRRVPVVIPDITRTCHAAALHNAVATDDDNVIGIEVVRVDRRLPLRDHFSCFIRTEREI